MLLPLILSFLEIAVPFRNLQKKVTCTVLNPFNIQVLVWSHSELVKPNLSDLGRPLKIKQSQYSEAYAYLVFLICCPLSVERWQMPGFPLTQLHLKPGSAQHSHSPLLLTTEQSHKGKWGLSAYIKGSSMVVAEGGKNTPCSRPLLRFSLLVLDLRWKPCSQKPACPSLLEKAEKDQY